MKVTHILAAAAVACGTSTVALAQGILELADGRTTVIPVSSGFLAADFKDAAIGVRLHQDLKPADPSANCFIPNHGELTTNVSFSAQKGKRALFDKGQLTPGVDVEPGFAWFREDRIDCQGDEPSAKHGYTALYIGFVGTAVGNDVVEYQPTDSAKIDTRTTTTAAINLSVNRYYGRSGIAGFSINAGKEWNSPGGDDPLQTCVAKSTGLDSDGNRITSSDCKNRFVAPLTDLRTVRMRVDHQLVFRARPQPKDAKPGNAAKIGLYTSLSTVSQSGLDTVYNAAVGPTVHPGNQISHLYGAFLIEARDLTNANGRHPAVKDRWSARLYAALPF